MLTQIIVRSLILITIIYPSFQACSPKDKEFLVTFHPHLDAFWLNTDTELKSISFQPFSFLYQMNQRNSKTIFNSMLESLSQSPSRKHFVTQVVFFKDWYEYLNSNDKKKVQQLIKNKQFEIVNAGWVENDQAVCYFDDILDQYSLGLNYLKNSINYTTNIGWATDSFGHSHSQVALQHLLGFQFQGIERVDERYIHQRKNESLLEFYWSPVSDSNNQSYGGVVTLVRHFLHEVNNLRSVTPQRIVSDYEKIDKIMEQLYHSPKLFRFFGNDFQEYIPVEFQNWQKAMELLNLNHKNPTQCPVFKYGNPSDYLSLMKTVYNQDSLPVRNFDFIPNWDQDHYWTGYYTTDPDLKKKCKDFSRLVNFYRKIVIKQPKNPHNNDNLQAESNELLALMQHHDGITATSKRHIEAEMKGRMKTTSDALVESIKKAGGFTKEFCSLYSGGNKCALQSREKTVYLSILHQGSKKLEKLEIEVSKNSKFGVRDANSDLFCFSGREKCTLVFEAVLFPGENVFVLEKSSSISDAPTQKPSDLAFASNSLSVSVRGYTVDYTFGQGQYFNFSLVKARSSTTMASTVSWDKYGQKDIKKEQRASGMYIMTNNGVLEPIDGGNYTSLEVVEGKVYTKIIVVSRLNTLTLTLKRGEEHIVDLQNVFQPPNLEFSDYFLRVQSKLNPKDEFFHDANGYLVMKRKVGVRPDYEWQYKVIDKIAANTYPMCSFAYLLQEQQKLVVFNDRAAGIALYEQSFLLNIDRIAGDDSKGVGQGYLEIVRNTFRHKVALTKTSDVLERQWQREYDEPLLAFFSQEQRKATAVASKGSEWLKYTVFRLTPTEFVVRLINLHDRQRLKLPKYSAKSWKIEAIGLNLEYQSIVESFTHGEPLSDRKHWKKVQKQVNIFESSKEDTDAEIVLRPLQIRSFRVTLSEQERK